MSPGRTPENPILLVDDEQPVIDRVSCSGPTGSTTSLRAPKGRDGMPCCSMAKGIGGIAQQLGIKLDKDLQAL